VKNQKSKSAPKPAPKQSLSFDSQKKRSKPPRKKTEAFLAKVARRRQRRLADAKSSGNTAKMEALSK
jgi:hypothetical protein